jgi:hypothetical protein
MAAETSERMNEKEWASWVTLAGHYRNPSILESACTSAPGYLPISQRAVVRHSHLMTAATIFLGG